MYHGDDSGHLMLFVNGNILSIDFDQQVGTKKSFLIENQVIELEINQGENKMEYVVTPQLPPQIEDDSPTFDKRIWIPLILVLLGLNLAVYLIKNLTEFG